MLFGFSEIPEIPQKIEFISFSSKYREQTLDVIRKSFFKFETVSVASEIDINPEGQQDLIKLCEDVLQRSNVSIIARDVENDLIVGVALNVIQVSFYENETCRVEKMKNKHLKPTIVKILRSNNLITMVPATLSTLEITCVKLKMQKV